MSSHPKHIAAAIAMRLLVVLPAILLLNGCSPASAKAKLKASPPAQARSGPTWRWDSLPQSTRMRIATLACQLQPKSTVVIASPTTGLLRLNVSTPQADLPSGFLWGEFDPESFAEEEHNLAEQLKKIEDMETMQWSINYPRQKMQLEQQIEEAGKRLETIRLLATDDRLFTNWLRGAGDRSLLKPDALAKAEEDYRLLKENLRLLQETNSAALGFDIASQRNDWSRRELDFKLRRQRARFEMPFDGRITFSIAVSQGMTNYPVNTGQEIAVARDISSVRVRVALENVAWTALPAEKLRAVIRSGGEILEAKFSFQKIEKIQNREEAAYYFEFPENKSAAAARLIGANVSCDLWIDLPEPARIVPKLTLVLHQPDAFKTRDWASALGAAFPGARLLVEGQTDLAVVPPREMKLSSAK